MILQEQAEGQELQSNMIKSVINIIKYYPVVMNVYILITMVICMIGFDINISHYTYTFIGQSFITNIILYFFSIKFKMCAWHRILIINMTICLLLETLHNFNLIKWEYSYLVVVLTILASLISVLWKKVLKKILLCR